MKHLPAHPWLVHPRTGVPLRAVGFSRRGPIWPIIGGDGSEDDANDQAEDDDAGDQTDDDGDKADEETDWKAKFEAEQRHKRNLERKAKKDAATIERLTGKKPEGGGKKDDEQPDAEKIKAEAKAEAAREVLASRVEDKIEAKARAFADPEDAVAVLLRSHDIEDFIDDGKPDADAIADALKELGEKKPHLLAQGGKKFEGDADQGTRKETKERPKTLGDAVTQHYTKR